ncbi:hypothetical protein GUJ93_ZPchr0014g46680 [Zizania palustris]|uniref:RRM domain-containing protein n=1 Tax=Zizania palustris TaxID=103762 RepID=A0A8J5TAP1_ZIZPA|nr:hypothetical protein GUJ93_ZPchr0014g46680 [Zizania palustris]
MALSLARSSQPAAALPAPRISRFAPLLRSPRRLYPCLGLLHRVPAAAVAASSPPESQAAADVEEGEEEQGEKRRKVYVANIPWSFLAPEIEKLFAQCGTVKDVEVIKAKDGRKRGFAFVTMATAEEAAAAVEKLNSFDVMGRIIKVEFSRDSENLLRLLQAQLWRGTDFMFFENPSGKSAGYGFVSFGTKEEAEAALNELDGKELMERPIRVRWRQNVDNTVDSVKADGEIEDVNIDGEAESVVEK